MAAAEAGSGSSDLTPSLGSSVYHRGGPKRAKKKKKRSAASRGILDQGQNPRPVQMGPKIFSLWDLRFHSSETLSGEILE